MLIPRLNLSIQTPPTPLTYALLPEYIRQGRSKHHLRYAKENHPSLYKHNTHTYELIDN